MSKIADWCNGVKDLVKDNPELQEKILELKSIDTDFDNALLSSEQANKTIVEKDAEISKLKDLSGLNALIDVSRGTQS